MRLVASLSWMEETKAAVNGPFFGFTNLKSSIHFNLGTVQCCPKVKKGFMLLADTEATGKGQISLILPERKKGEPRALLQPQSLGYK